MASLWTDIDNWILVNLAAQMGKASAYSSLKIASYHDEILTMPQEWAELTMPAAFVESSNGTIGEPEHDLFSPNQIVSYRYGVAVVTLEATKIVAKDNAKTLSDRLRQFMYYAYKNLPRLDNGNGSVSDVVFGECFVRPFMATKPGFYYGFAIQSFDVLVHSRSN